MIYHYNEVPIFYQLTGNGPALVLVHGFLESSMIWQEFIQPLSCAKTVITLDLPGHGKSGCINEVHSMEEMAEVIFSLLKFLHIETAAFVGHSMGGYVLLALAEKRHRLIDSLTLLNATTKEDSEQRKLNRERAIVVIQKNKASFLSMAISNLFAEGSQGKHTAIIEQLKKAAVTFPTEGVIAAIRGMKIRKDRTLVLKNFGRKKLLICGDKDPIIPLSISKITAKETNTKLKVLDGGHMSWYENYIEIVKILHLND